MAKHSLSFIELHNQLFMVGSNLGTKINAQQRGAKLTLDTDLNLVWIEFKGKKSFIPLSNIASGDLLVEAAPVKEAAPEEQEATLPPAIARARRGRPAKAESGNVEVPVPNFDPSDVEAAARHRELVRAASANAYRTAPIVQNDHLIQQARNAAMGVKTHQTAQVQNAQQVGALAGVTGKKKAISHAELQIQVKAEAKE